MFQVYIYMYIYIYIYICICTCQFLTVSIVAKHLHVFQIFFSFVWCVGLGGGQEEGMKTPFFEPFGFF